MRRPPNNQRPLGGAGGGFAPPSYYPPNPIFSPITGQFRNHSFVQPQFQNPSFVQPQFQNPSFVHPQFQNPRFVQPQLQNPSPGQSYNPYVQNPCLPSTPNLGPSRQDVIDRAEGAALRAHRELVTAGESVSAWKVSQAVLVDLKVDSWASLGIQLQDVPSIHRLIVTEGKVNAFIHCFVGARRITSLYDLEMAICKNESVEQFEGLGLGPICRHPLAMHYFSIPSDMLVAFKITSEDIIICLQDFLSYYKKQMVTAEEFLGFLVEQKSVSAKENLGVRIQSLGLHISFIRKGWKAEKSTLNRSLHKSDNGREREEINLSHTPDKHMEKQVLDKRFCFISNRIKSFSSAWGDFSGKHTRFESSPDIDDEDDNECRNYMYESSSHNKDSALCVSSCPYPSTTEEMVRLGLKSEIDENASTCVGEIMENGDRKSSGKKRKFNEKNNNASTLCKLLKKEQFVNLEKYQKKSVNLFLTNRQIEKFITMWKEACRQDSVAEVLERMVVFYKLSAKQQRRVREILSTYPGVVLLHIAVASIKSGMLDSLYDTFQTFGEHGITQTGSVRAEMIEIGPSTNNNAILNINKDTEELGTYTTHLADVTVDDISKRIAEFFDSDNLASIERALPPRRQLAYLKKFHDCEIWLMTQFSAKQFSSLGHGDFYEFLERHVSLLPNELHRFLSGGLHELSCAEAYMLQQQLVVLLCQAESNLLDTGTVSKYDVSMLLKKQFPTICFRIVGNEPKKCFTDLTKGQKDSGKTNCILFSSALLGKCQTRSTLVSCERASSETAEVVTQVCQQACSFGTSSFEDAIECLLKAPMLSDLQCWSHWDLIYAPSLGPLMEWLLNEVHSKELLCIATCDGKLVRIDPSATLDEFLEAMVQCCSYLVALKLLSLLYLYRGTSNAPVSLLKCYAQRAVDVIMRNSVDFKEIKNNEKALLHSNPSHMLIDVDKESSANSFSDVPPTTFEAINHGSVVRRSLDRTSKAIGMISRFVLECLGHLPSEFRIFAAEILVSGLRSFTKDAALHILHECTETSQRIMLHDVGLALGITEWIDDYRDFISIAVTDYTSSKTRNTDGLSSCSKSAMDWKHTQDTSEKPFSDDSKALCTVVNASLAGGKQGPVCESHADLNLTDDYCKPYNQVHERENYKRVTREKSDILDDRKVQEANLIIESIRQEEFGLDSNLNSTENCLLKKQHARLGRALHCLSQELYSQDSHLLLELVQNADDNVYSESVDPTLVFILQGTGIVILNNERGFTVQNIRALCDIGNSTKKGSTAGYIGHKGIGFKSVFRVTDAPEIHSNGFHVKFDITEGQIGFVLPTVIPPCDISTFRESLSGEDYETCATHWDTCILLPFKSKFKEVAGMSSIISMFSDLHPSLLLFLHRLQCIKFKNLLDDTLIVMRKETQSDGIIKVSHGKETMSWLVASKKLQASVIRHDIQSTEIAMAFTLQETLNGEYKPHLGPQPVFSFLPLRNYGLKFIIQGDFVLPSSREEVDGDNAWNQWLLSELPALFVSSVESFCALPCFHKNTWKALTAYMSFVPIVGEVHGFFSYLPHMIISKLRMSKCLLLDGPDMEWVFPCRVLRGWDEQTRLLISDGLLQEHLGLGYLHRGVILSDALAKALGIQDYGPKVFVDIISSLCRKDGIKSCDLALLSSLLAVLYSTLLVHSTQNAGLEHHVISNLKRTPFIPLSDGSYSSVADGPIWLPCDCFSIGFEGKQSPRDFPSLYAKLRIVTPLLFCADTTNRCKMGDATTNNLIKMLHKIGVQELSAHEVIKSHILVALIHDKHNNKDRNLMIEYLSFIMLHFQYSCEFCFTEKADIISALQKESILLTNHGYRCPGAEPIHFGREYGNPVDIFKLIDPVVTMWLEVDDAYLKHPSSKFLKLASTKWRNFFEELGVTDFVQVNRVDKNISDFATPGTMLCGDLILTSSYVSDWESPELVNLLSILSSKKCRKKCIYLLEVLDKMWDDCYRTKARLLVVSKTIEDEKPIESSFMKSIREFRWISSTLDTKLHQSNDLFYDCEDVRSILGTMAPYAVPQVASKLLLKDIGFKTQVALDDALTIFHSWRMSEAPLMASTAQMLKFYTFISDGLATSNVDTTKEFISSPFIYIPCENTSRHNDVVSGMFLSPKEVYWQDPSGCVDRTKEMILLSGSFKGTKYPSTKALATIYPSLHDFFLNVCGVSHVPTFGSYLEILLQLTTVALPSQAAHAIFRVFLKLADDLNSGLVKSEEIFDLKESLLKSENTALPTLQDKWVSLHPSFGLVCWSDDEELTQQFKHSDGVYFLQFGELSGQEKEMLAGKVSFLLKAIGVPALSEVVSRDAIFYGTVDNSEKYSLINWVLPFAQRYLYKSYPDIYLDFKQFGFKQISQLQVVVVEKLFYKHTLKGRDSTSMKRLECNCLLQGNILYATRISDHHSVFLELSRFFLNGSTELHLANFLHMITTMAESGSTREQMEFFIVNSQKVPRLPDDEPLWSLSSLLEWPDVETSQPVCPPPINTEQNNSVARKKPGISLTWPPTDWKTAPDFEYARKHHQLTRQWPGLSCSQNDLSKPLKVVTQVDFPVQIDADWVIEESLQTAGTLMLQESLMTKDRAHRLQYFDSVDRPINSSLEPKGELVEASLAHLSTFPESDMWLPTPDENQARKTGRLGEIIAYKYFAEKLGSTNVKWVNEETETGLPYDLISGEGKNREYIEVKATKYVNKGWFLITTREWQFAVEKGNAFSIAHVVLFATKKARITILRNPVKLCQQNALGLAVLMSKQLKDSSVTTKN